MIKTNTILLALLISTLSFGQKKKDLIKQVNDLKSEIVELKKETEVNFEDDLQKFSYAYATVVGSNVKTIGYDSLNYVVFSKALKDFMNDASKMNLKEAQTYASAAIDKIKEEEAKRMSAEGEAFLAENGKKSTVVTTQSGLQYEVINTGNGAKPKSTDKVKVHYTGMLTDGKVFDSSVERNEPAVFGVTQVIKGWQEALQLMQVGDKWKVFIPQNLAYGARGAGGGEIPGYAALVFEVELLEIVTD